MVGDLSPLLEPGRVPRNKENSGLYLKKRCMVIQNLCKYFAGKEEFSVISRSEWRKANLFSKNLPLLGKE